MQGKRILLCRTRGPIQGIFDFAREKNTEATIFVPSAEDPLSFKTPTDVKSQCNLSQ